jgi:hypothetical protein
VDKFQLASHNTQSVLDQPITFEEVKHVIKKIKSGKAVGLDGMFNELFIFGGEQVAIYLWKVFQIVWESEEFPEV